MLYQIIVYVPVSDAENLKKALFDAGAGRYQNYDQCAWETSGHGQFRPLDGAKPAIGTLNEREYVEEMKIETICTRDSIHNVLEALLKAHPYEEPAYGVIELKTIKDFNSQ